MLNVAAHFRDRFFSETGAGKHVPRCVMVDLESGSKFWDRELEDGRKMTKDW